MAATYISASVATVDPGNNYSPSSGTDTCLVYIAYSRRPAPPDNSANDGSWTFGATGMTEVANTDVTQDIAGGADPTMAAAELVNPGTSSATLDMTWANAISSEGGCALTLDGVDQTTPVSDSDSATYSGDASPSINYTAPDNSVVIYFRFHAQNTNPIWTDPTGFTIIHNRDLITSPAYRTCGVWYKNVTTAETTSVSATSDAAGDGGVHGVIVFQEPTVGGGLAIPVAFHHLRQMRQ